MWFSIVCTLILNSMRHHSDQNVRDSRGAVWTITSTVQLLQTFKEELWSASLEFEKKGIAWHIDTNSAVWTLMYNSKLADQIVRLVLLQ